MGLLIRSARSADDERLREVARAAKAHWGYDAAVVEAWASSLELGEDEERWVAEADGVVVAWASLVPPAGGVAVPDDLWVDPAWMLRGLGRRLFGVAADRARELDARSLEFGAEPNAIGFYERVGARYLRDHVTEWNRPGKTMGIAL